MNKPKYNVLLVEDHPMILEGYENAFLKVKKQYKDIEFNIDNAQDCNKAINLIKRYCSKNQVLDIVFLDIRLPCESKGNLISGEDIGIEIRKMSPETKIIVATSLNDNYRIHGIFKSINPEGFLVKTDTTSKEIIEAIASIINNVPYYSKTILKLLRKSVSNDFLLDDIDRRILYEISIGTKTKELPNTIPLSITGIEKRKRHLKQIFDVDGKNDRALVLIAKEKGFI